MVTIRDKTADTRLQAIADALLAYEKQHPNANVEVYRQNSVSVRVRIVDPDFTGVSKADRHDDVWNYLEPLDEELQAEISILLLLTPKEMQNSFANYDFENPIPSQL